VRALIEVVVIVHLEFRKIGGGRGIVKFADGRIPGVKLVDSQYNAMGIALNRLVSCFGSAKIETQFPFDGFVGFLGVLAQLRVVRPFEFRYLAVIFQPVKLILSYLGQRVAAKTGAAITLVSHYNKNVLAGTRNRVLGSSAFVAFPRAVFGIAKDPDDQTQAILFPIKCNYSSAIHSLRFSMEMPDGESEPKRLHFDPAGIEDFDPDANAGMQSPKTDGARDFLLEELSDGKVVNGMDLKARAKDQGINEKTLWYAAKKIGIKMEPSGLGKSRQVFWSIQDV